LDKGKIGDGGEVEPKDFHQNSKILQETHYTLDRFGRVAHDSGTKNPGAPYLDFETWDVGCLHDEGTGS
jgi:hypothetical protein